MSFRRILRILPLIVLLALGRTLVSAETDRGVGMSPEGAESALKVGKQYIVLIAISAYQQWAPLTSPVKDARELKDILVSRYRIDRAYELYDEQATKANIIRLLVRLQKEIQIDDSLLILYAGHGHLDKSSNSGFWIPVNAGTEVYEQQNWLPHTQLRGLLSNIAATHLFVISDSCFAGDLIQATRSLPDAANADYLRKAYARVCRQVLTSGATEAVPDVSDFALQLKSILKRNQNPCLDTFTLYNDIRLGVSSSVPLLGSLAGTGHQEGASFLLFLQPGIAAAQEQPAGPRATEPGAMKTAAKRANFLSASLGFGAAFPVADVSGAIQTAPIIWSKAHYNFCLDWGAIGIGLLAGALKMYSKEELAYGYQILSFPVAVELRYQSLRERPLCLSAAVAAGVAPSRIHFDEEGMDEVSVAKLLLAPSLSLGSRRFRHFRIFADAGCLLIFFDNHPFSGVFPGIRVEYAF